MTARITGSKRTQIVRHVANFLITLASLKSPVAGSPVRLNLNDGLEIILLCLGQGGAVKMDDHPIRAALGNHKRNAPFGRNLLPVLCA